MKQTKLKQFLLLELLFMILLGGIHYLIITSFLPPIYASFKVVLIYIFLLSFSLLGTWAIFTISKNDDSLIGKGFLVFTVLKILGSFAFLLPFLLNQDESTKPFVYQFFAVFFPSLILETLIILKLTNLAEVEKIKKQENQ
ncbi:MAG: hypothetical protein R3279_00135 [Putridiphycobacter sp.]|nr:hypothetical protein [Putridiphycobacter sp.]